MPSGIFAMKISNIQYRDPQPLGQNTDEISPPPTERLSGSQFRFYEQNVNMIIRPNAFGQSLNTFFIKRVLYQHPFHLQTHVNLAFQPLCIKFQVTFKWSKLVKLLHFSGRRSFFRPIVLKQRLPHLSASYRTQRTLNLRSGPGAHPTGWDTEVCCGNGLLGSKVIFTWNSPGLLQEKKNVVLKHGWKPPYCVSPWLKTAGRCFTASSRALHGTNQLDREWWDNQVNTDMPRRYTRLPETLCSLLLLFFFFKSQTMIT